MAMVEICETIRHSILLFGARNKRNACEPAGEGLQNEPSHGLLHIQNCCQQILLLGLFEGGKKSHRFFQRAATENYYVERTYNETARKEDNSEDACNMILYI